MVKYAFEFVDCEDKKPKRIPDAKCSVSLGSMAPLTGIYELHSQELTGVSENSLKSGSKVIYLVGSVTYDTVFTEGRVTNFRYLVGAGLGGPGNGEETSTDNAGNDAT